MSLDAENWLFGVEDECPRCREEEGKCGGNPNAVCEDHANEAEND